MAHRTQQAFAVEKPTSHDQSRRLVISPELAYGSQGTGNGTIPPNATLVFTIELLNVQ